MADKYPFIPYFAKTHSEAEMIAKTENFYQLVNKRRSIREFSNKLIPRKIIENIIRMNQ